MALLRGGMSVTDACMAVGATSLGSFSSKFAEIVGESPSSYRAREHAAIEAMPECFARILGRPPYVRAEARAAAGSASSRIGEGPAVGPS
jgi:AraC-like DNA-binding protein